jgi:hypothetical protein
VQVTTTNPFRGKGELRTRCAIIDAAETVQVALIVSETPNVVVGLAAIAGCDAAVAPHKMGREHTKSRKPNATVPLFISGIGQSKIPATFHCLGAEIYQQFS